MYRIGHGDCFLLAFPGHDPNEPVYVLIDCGYKPGSPGFIEPSNPQDVATSIRTATGNRLDVVVMTHEHQDHVNNFTAKNFANVAIGQVWLAWTEDPQDPLANKLRAAYHDQLLGLAEARNRLAAAGDDKRAEWIDEFLAFELGGELLPPQLGLAAAAKNPLNSANKVAMKLIKDRAGAGNIEYLKPHSKILKLPGDIRVYPLGPPHDAATLKDLDPQGGEEFRLAAAMSSPVGYFAAAVTAGDGQSPSPFSPRFAVPLANMHDDPSYGAFFANFYGFEQVPSAEPAPKSPTFEPSEIAENNPQWRRIDNEWLHSAEELALAMNSDTNNASLVLAFELGVGGKVLLFAADAQRGNWRSWADKPFDDGDQQIQVKDLLGRAVLYKVGHHCSHNATLNGEFADDYPCLGWMARGQHANEFTSLITAVRKWAETQKGWDHPRKEIKDALLVKCAGRVLQTDTGLAKMAKPVDVSQSKWDEFLNRVTETPLYFDYPVKID